LLFDLSRSYTVSFVLAGMAGVLNLAVLAYLRSFLPSESTQS